MLKNKKFILSAVLSIVVLLVILIFSMSSKNHKSNTVHYASTNDEINQAQLQAVKDLLTEKSDDIVLGKKDAPIKVIVYDSYSCFYCATFFTKIFPLIKSQYIDNGKVAFIHRDFPLNVPALMASKITRCFAKKGIADQKLFNIISGIFESQNDWLVSEGYKEKLVQIFEFIGFKKEDILACSEDEDMESSILEGRLQASKILKITGTPTFFINGEILNKNYSFQSFQEEIDRILNKE